MSDDVSATASDGRKQFGGIRSLNSVRCTIVEWLSDEPQSGWVRAEIVDAYGRKWDFFDKPPIFTEALVTAITPLPLDGKIRCEIRGRSTLADGRRVARIYTIDGEAKDGERLFLVEESRLERTEPDRFASPGNDDAID